MRVDVGIWTNKKLLMVKKNEKNKRVNDDKFESHWLRFERDMGPVKLLQDN